MSVLVLGCGRTGTNMLLESLRGSQSLRATDPAEHKTLFRQPVVVPDDYLSKCDTCYIDNFAQIDNILNMNQHMRILWTIRDLRDCSLSKIYRGQPGNDVGSLSDDATLSGCIQDIEWMSQIYNHLLSNHGDKIMLVKMEDMILQYEETIKNACRFCDIEYEDNMKNFTSRFRGSVKTTKGKRYNGLDKSQVSMYERKYEIYNGFYKSHDINLDILFDKLTKYLIQFNYKV